MRATATDLPEVLILEPVVYEDSRGYFFEAFNRRAFAEATGLTLDFVQDNESRSGRGVLRGIHYQYPNPQGKLVRAIDGSIFDVAVDLRRSSPTFLRWVGIELSAENRRQLWVPEGFGHAFLTLSDSARVLYKTTAEFESESDRVVAWNDPDIGVAWNLDRPPVLSAKDAAAPQTSTAPFLFP